MFSRIFSILLLVVVIGAAALFYTGPVMAFKDIRSSAEAQDIQSLANLVDFDRLRESLRAQLDPETPEGGAAPAPSVLNDPIGAAGKIIKDAAKSIGKSVGAAVDPQNPAYKAKPTVNVDKYLTPKAILGLTYGAGKKAPKFNKNDFMGNPPEPKMTYFSLNRARLEVNAESDGVTSFTFERKGLTQWQLVHVGLPGYVEPAKENPKVEKTTKSMVE